MRKMWVCALCVGLTLGACGGDGSTGDDTGDGGAAALADGKELFEENCATCHGEDLKGTSAGPPFLNDIYEPGHHPDESFYAAVAGGVRAHHWGFGDMPPVPGLSEQDVTAIIAYVRDEQRAAGIE